MLRVVLHAKKDAANYPFVKTISLKRNNLIFPQKGLQVKKNTLDIT
jgi:hypothetical protein